MPSRYELAFQPVRNSSQSSAPAFDVTLSTASTANALQSSGVREWDGPSGRAVRFAETSGVDYRVAFGSSTIVAGTTGNTLVLGGAAEAFYIQPGQTYVAIMTTSTQISAVNIAIGFGR